MNFDISQLLENWDYQPGHVQVRKFIGKDGQEKIQLRLDLGLLQMNAHGRPDGKHPLGHESLLEYYARQLVKYREANDGSDEGFLLDADDCAKLQQEAIQYHHRYICLFQLDEYDSVVRDAERNLKVFEMVKRYAASEELFWGLQQLHPQLLMMRTRALGQLELENGNYQETVTLIEEGLEQIRNFYRENGRYDLLDQSGELRSLETWLDEIASKRPITERERLEIALDEAVRNEDYEKAAQVRDALRNLKAR